MFSTLLRNRPVWEPVVPKMIASQIPRWTEKSLQNHDIAVPVPRRDNPGTQIRMLLLSALDFQAGGDGPSRLERLYHLEGGRHVAVVFLVESDSTAGVEAYMELQKSLLISSFEMPIIPLSSVLALPETLFTYQQQLLQPRHARVVASPATALLPYCSEGPPLAEHTVNVLSDIFHSLRELAMAATAGEGQEEIRRWLGQPTPQHAEGVIAFWLQEYVAD